MMLLNYSTKYMKMNVFSVLRLIYPLFDIFSVFHIFKIKKNIMDKKKEKENFDPVKFRNILDMIVKILIAISTAFTATSVAL